MQDELELHGQWYIPRLDETFSGFLFIHREKKQIYLQIVSVAKLALKSPPRLHISPK